MPNLHFSWKPLLPNHPKNLTWQLSTKWCVLAQLATRMVKWWFELPFCSTYLKKDRGRSCISLLIKSFRNVDNMNSLAGFQNVDTTRIVIIGFRIGRRKGNPKGLDETHLVSRDFIYSVHKGNVQWFVMTTFECCRSVLCWEGSTSSTYNCFPCSSLVVVLLCIYWKASVVANWPS